MKRWKQVKRLTAAWMTAVLVVTGAAPWTGTQLAYAEELPAAALPVITYDQEVTSTAPENVPVTASVYSETELSSATLYYKDGSEADYDSVSMDIGEPVDGFTDISAEIPAEVMLDADTVDYYFEAENAVGVTREPEEEGSSYELEIERAEEPSEGSLLITEIVFNAFTPSAYSSWGEEAFEYVEVYNNSSETVNLSDYYVYRENYNSGTNYKWPLPSQELKPWKTVVLRGMKSKSAPDLSVFNEAYGINLSAEEAAVLDQTGGGNLPNTGTYTYSLKRSSNDETVTSARYNDAAINNTEAGDNLDNTSVIYQYNPDNVMMTKMGVKQTPTPGTVLPGQVPFPTADDVSELPVISYEPAVSESTPQDVAITADVESDSELESATLYYKGSNASIYKASEMTVEPAGTDEFTISGIIPAEVLTTDQTIEYFFAVENEAGFSQSPAAFGETYSFDVYYDGEAPYLLITEIVFNSPNVDGNDVSAWEYIELYNNSNKVLSLQDYYIDYADLSGATKSTWTFKDDVRMQPGQTLVLRQEPVDDNGTVAKFNTAYKLTGAAVLDEDDFAEYTGSGNLVNADARVTSIMTKSGVKIVSAAYNESDDGNGPDNLNETSVTYMPNYEGNEMIKSGVKVTATPGALLAGQAPAAPVELADNYLPPVIEHTRVAASTTVKDLVIPAVITEETVLTDAKLYYKTDLTADYTSVPLTLKEGTAYEATVPASALEGAQKLYYYLEASDGVFTTKKLDVNQTPFEVQIFASVSSDIPALLITELVPDAKGSDKYEYVELYNNSSQTVNLKDYQMRYEFYHGANMKWDLSTDLELPAGETAVIWLQSDLSKGEPVSSFNSHWGVDLPEDRVMPIYVLGMNNSDEGRIIISEDSANVLDHARNAIVQAWYNVGIDEVNDDGKSVVYEYPKDGSTKMYKRSAAMTATPGTLLEGQVPETLVTAAEDAAEPVIKHNPVTGTVPFGAQTLEATVTDDQSVKRVTLFFKRDIDSDYKQVNMKRLAAGSDTFVSDTLEAGLLLGASGLEYYIEAADGHHIVSTGTFSLQFENKPLSLELEDGAYVSGTVTISGSADEADKSLQLSLDGQALATEEATHESPVLTYRADDMQSSFQNGFFINDELISILPASSYLDQKYIQIPKNALKPGENTIKITAGTASDPLEFGTSTNNDDYRIEGVELLLPDGSSAEVVSARGKTLNADSYTSIDPSARQKVGDSSGYFEYIEITFDVPASVFQGVYASLDTTTIADGEHTVTLSAGGENQSAAIKVDNTAPVFETFSLEDGVSYSGIVTMDATLSDVLSGIESVTATLDGKAIALPYELQSSELLTGEHTFKVIGTDNAGNEAIRSAVFTIGFVSPDAPFNPTPADGATDVSRDATLSVTANDVSGEPVDITFGQGYRYNYKETSGAINAYSNAADREPPAELNPAGETAFTADAVSQVAQKDGQYYVTDAAGLFPYQRYEFRLDEEPANIAELEVVWQGHSLAGRQVTMYTWDYMSGKWVAAASGVGVDDFELKASVNAETMVQDKTIQVLIQDLIAEGEETAVSNPEAAEESEDGTDFTFAWSSDTQYYSDSYPEIYKAEMEFVAAMKEKKNIKYLIHTGDLVDDWDRPDEWKVASDSMKILEDAGVPYGVVTGNHDVNHDDADYTEYWKYFGRDRFEDQPYYGDDLHNNRDHYDLISANGQDFLIMYLGWNIMDDTVEWANEILAKYPNRYVIIGTHEYISPSGAYSGQGEMIWNEIVAKNDNVKMVLCGHLHGVAYNVKHVGDRTVVEMLADYQSGPMGGSGYMRFLEFDVDQQQIHVTTYSPYLDDDNYFENGSDDFYIPFVTQDPAKQVATDYIGVNLYSSNEIGTQHSVANGTKASATWSGLEANTQYFWYAKATDAYGTATWSDIWSFVTGAGDGSSGGGGDNGSGGDDNDDDDNGSGHGGGSGSGGGSNSGSSSGTTTNDQKWTEIGVSDISSSGDTVKLSANGDSEAIVFTSGALKAIGDRDVSITFENGSILVISAAQLAALMDELGTNEKLYVSTEKASSQTIGNAADALGNDRKANITVAGESVEIIIGITGKDGETEALTAPVTITLPASGIQDERLAGIYHIAADGTVSWIGGDYANGSYTATVEESGTYVVLAYSKSFTDVPANNWAYEYVQLLSFYSIANGLDDDTFGAAKSTTRAEFVTLLARAFGLEATSGNHSFSDVAEGSWYSNAVEAAFEAGIVQGVSADRFDPGKEITREEMIVMIVRTLEELSVTKLSAADSGFTDFSQISDWAKDAVNKAYGLGLITGKGGDSFDPNGPALRSETAKVLVLMLEQMPAE